MGAAAAAPELLYGFSMFQINLQMRTAKPKRMAAILRRAFSTTALRRSASAAASAGEHGSSKPWKLATFFVVMPGIGLCSLNAYQTEQEHMSHHERPEFVAFSHLRLRTKGFPWGDGNHSAFHNSHVNALPEGYEEGDHH